MSQQSMERTRQWAREQAARSRKNTVTSSGKRTRELVDLMNVAQRTPNKAARHGDVVEVRDVSYEYADELNGDEDESKDDGDESKDDTDEDMDQDAHEPGPEVIDEPWPYTFKVSAGGLSWWATGLLMCPWCA